MPLLSNDKELEDPSLSSASLCIQLELLDSTFHPVFTHQVFPGEHIRGWQPPRQIMLERFAAMTNKESKQEDFFHSSHRHHQHQAKGGASCKELSIRVRLAPSCQSCHVELDVGSGSLPRRSRRMHGAHKRRRIDAVDTNHDNKRTDGGTDGTHGKDPSDFNHDSPSEHDDGSREEEDEDWNENEDDQDDQGDSELEDEDEKETEKKVDNDTNHNEGITRGARMPTKEIIQSMKRGLPPVVDHAKGVNDEFLRRPLGVELKEYTTNEKVFVLCLANGSEAAKYHQQVQRLALWYIETADDVDVASTEGGYWKVLYLFQKHKRTQFSLAGYVTLFHFHAPFKKPKPGIIIRICQALILPPYQRSGHGQQMLTCLGDIAHGQYAVSLSGTKKAAANDDIVEINVESPAPAFVMLRNRTDFECFLQSLKDNDPWISLDQSKIVLDADYFTSPSESAIVQAAAKAKIIPRQVQIVMELYKLYQLQEYLRSTKNNNKDELEKRFRLMVKARLNKENREHLSGHRTKAEKQAFLEAEYRKCISSYMATLPKTTLP